MSRPHLLLLPLLLAACSQQPAEPQATAPATTAAPTISGARPPSPAEPAIASYLCDSGNRVDLVHEGAYARIAMSDGRVVRLGRIDNSKPSTWTDVGLRFVIRDDHAELSEDESGRTLRCEPEDTAAETANDDAE